MAWDSQSSQGHSGPATKSLTIQPKPASPSTGSASVQPVSAHVADAFLADFLDPSFDPIKYLNAVLPPLQTSGGRGGAGGARSGAGPGSPRPAVPLSELSAQAQAQVTQLSAHTARLSATLTQLTDDILRSGSRLAYEVELLRGETLGLAETLTEGLQDEMAKFAPGKGADAAAGEDGSAAADGASSDPACIAQLRTLTLVRSRLELVIKTFGDAMEFVFPPSEVSVGSSFLSVSAPDPGKEAHSTEEKGRQVLQRLRDEVTAMLASSDPQGIEEAVRRVEELKDLNKVWRGTAEERGRTKFLESLAKLVEDRHRDLLRELEQAKRDGARAESDLGGASSKKAVASSSGASSGETRGYGGGYGFISQLQKIRGGL